MTYETPLYRAWWLYGALIALGALLILVSWGSDVLWLAGLTLIAAGVGALLAFRRGWSPNCCLLTILSEEGVTFRGHPALSKGIESDYLIPWTEIIAVRVLPRPGYWLTQIQALQTADEWLLTGHDLELAENIAQVASLPYDETSRRQTRMGNEHYWTRLGT